MYSGARQTVSGFLIPFLVQSWLPSLVSSGWGNLSYAMGHSGAKGIWRGFRINARPNPRVLQTVPSQGLLCQGSPDKQDSPGCAVSPHTQTCIEDAFKVGSCNCEGFTSPCDRGRPACWRLRKDLQFKSRQSPREPGNHCCR